MTLVSSIIADAFRESNILPIGVAPNANQQTEALRLYNQNISSLYGSEAGEDLNDWPLGTLNYENPNYGPPYIVPDPYRLVHPPINQRLLATNTAPTTVFLTPFPQDGSRMVIVDQFNNLAANPITLNANGHTIEGNPTVVLNVNGTFREWFYRSDLGSWEKLTSLLYGDNNPFPSEFDIFFIIGLAIRLNPRYGRELDPQTASVFKAQRNQVIARYLQSVPLEIDDSISWPFMSRQSFDQQRNFSGNYPFNQGNYSSWFGRS